MKKIAVITGDTSNLGRRLAKDFLLAGFIVVGISRKVEGVVDVANYHHIQRDIALNPEELIDEIVKRFGLPDVFINNAAAYTDKKVVETTLEEYQHILLINVEIPFRFLRALHTHYKAEGVFKNGFKNRSIVNVISASMYPEIARSSNRLLGVYSISKAALAMFTVAAAKESVEYGMRINAVSPSYFTNQPKKIAAIGAACVSLATGNVNGVIVQYDDPSLLG